MIDKIKCLIGLHDFVADVEEREIKCTRCEAGEYQDIFEMHEYELRLDIAVLDGKISYEDAQEMVDEKWEDYNK